MPEMCIFNRRGRAQGNRTLRRAILFLDDKYRRLAGYFSIKNLHNKYMDSGIIKTLNLLLAWRRVRLPCARPVPAFIYHFGHKSA